MPCYTENIMSLEFKPANKDVLLKAVQSLLWRLEEIGPGWYQVHTLSQTIHVKDGVATGTEQEVNRLRVAYTQAAMQKAKSWAKSKGWGVKQISANEAEFTIGRPG